MTLLQSKSGFPVGHCAQALDWKFDPLRHESQCWQDYRQSNLHGVATSVINNSWDGTFRIMTAFLIDAQKTDYLNLILSYLILS